MHCVENGSIIVTYVCLSDIALLGFFNVVGLWCFIEFTTSSVLLHITARKKKRTQSEALDTADFSHRKIVAFIMA